jgi:DNA-binding CsgD family transcriptional regulator
MPIRLPTTCPVFVGRDGDLRVLMRLIEQARSGRFVLALVSGEAGVGKSRLVAEAVASAREIGYSILPGMCSERDREYPFAPFVDALRQRLAQPECDATEFLGQDTDALLELLPELGRQGFHGAPVVDLSPEQSMRRLFEAVVSVLCRESGRQPLVLMLEDLHWADPTSLELLTLLPRRLQNRSVVVIGTIRSYESNPHLDGCVNALRHARDVAEIILEPLSDTDVTLMIDAMRVDGVSRVITRLIQERAGGNPFFVEELLATWAHDQKRTLMLPDDELPVTVRDTVLRRLADLSAEVQTVARAMAVAGHSADIDLVTASCGLDRASTTAALATVRERGIVEFDGVPGQRRVVFKHALTRDAILGQIEPRQRVDLHRSVAEHIERSASDRDALASLSGTLGYHYHAAGDWAETLAYAQPAGEAAWRVFATVEALGHFRRALDAAIALGHPATAALHNRCGQALDLLGMFDDARGHFEAAISVARVARDTSAEQMAQYELASLYASRDYRLALDHAERALELSRANHDRRQEGRSLNRLGNVLTNMQRFHDGRVLHERALELFTALDDDWGSADSLDLIAMTRYLAGDVPGSRHVAKRAAELFEQQQALDRVASALIARGFPMAIIDGPCATDAVPAECRADLARALELCRSLGWRAGETFAVVGLACLSIVEGDPAAALGHLNDALLIVSEIEHQQWTAMTRMTFGIFHAAILDDARAEAQFELALAVAQRAGAIQWETRLRVWIARCRARLGDVVTAETMLAGLLPETDLPETIGQRRALFTRAEILLGSEKPDEAAKLVDRLIAVSAPIASAEVLLLQARVLACQGARESADAVVDEARRLAEVFGPRAVLWQAAALSADLWRGRDDARSLGEATLARAEIERLASLIPNDDWRATFLSAPEVRRWRAPTRAGRTRTTGLDALTRREREVLTFVVSGLTNKEIAARLSLAEKTVEMHVGNCLGKLGCSTRTQLATWALANGIVSNGPAQG